MVEEVMVVVAQQLTLQQGLPAEEIKDQIARFAPSLARREAYSVVLNLRCHGLAVLTPGVAVAAA